MMMDRQCHLAADAQLGMHQFIERVADEAANRIGDRHDPVVGRVRLDLAEDLVDGARRPRGDAVAEVLLRSEEHTSELQSLMRISYAVFCLKKKKITNCDDN